MSPSLKAVTEFLAMSSVVLEALLKPSGSVNFLVPNEMGA